MVEEEVDDDHTAEEWLSRVQERVPLALEQARQQQVKGFRMRWKMIISKLEQIPSRLSDLSSHPCFYKNKNALCKEQLQALCNTLDEAIGLAKRCMEQQYEGKLRMQSDLDSLSGRLDTNLRDCALLIRSGILSEAAASASACSVDNKNNNDIRVRDLLARLQIGHLEAKHRALEALVEIFTKEEEEEEEKQRVLSIMITRSNISALIKLLMASTSPRIREKTVTLICSLLTEAAAAGSLSSSCEDWLVQEGVIPPLVRLLESGGVVGKEKAVISLQRLSMSMETARLIVGCGGVPPLIELCRSTGGDCDSVSQAAAACTLKNISAVPEVKRVLAEEGIVRVVIDLLDRGIMLESKEYAAECLQNLTESSNDNSLRRSVISQGGIGSLLSYLDGSLPPESAHAVGALRNLVGTVPIEVLERYSFLPRIAHVLKSGPLGAQQAAASAICRVCGSSTDQVKKMVGEAGCIPLLVNLLGAKTNGVREVAAQALSSLITLSCNTREVKKDDRSVPNMVQLLDPSPQNTAKKYAVSCLLVLSSNNKCKKLMISYGAIGYLKKLSGSGMEVPGAKKLLERLERGKLRSLFGRK
ncbi:hypothetical protein Dimus_025215 [Dionaea muscipula]